MLSNIAGGAQPFFAERGDVGVVLEEDASAQAAFDFVAHWIVGPAGKVGGLAHHSGFHLDNAGDGDPGADKPAAAAILIGEAVNGVTHFADDVVAAQRDFYAECDFFEKLAVGADGRNAQVGAAEIDSDGKIRHGQKGIRKSTIHVWHPGQ